MPADITAPFTLSSITFDAAGLVPVIAQDVHTREVLMLAHANLEAVTMTLETKKGTYYSRSRGRLWVKGEQSGHTQLVSAVTLDCDGDALLYSVDQTGAACHTGQHSCFHNPLLGDAPTSGSAIGATLDALYATILERFEGADPNSYVYKLHSSGMDRVLAAGPIIEYSCREGEPTKPPYTLPLATPMLAFNPIACKHIIIV